MEDIEIRPMTNRDIPEVVSIENLSYSAPWTRREFYAELNFNRFARYFVVEKNQKIIGYIGSWFFKDFVHITNVTVHPDFRNKGIGRKLMNYIIDLAKSRKVKKVVLEVRVSNTIAQKLYKNLGFRVEKIRKEYYPDNKENALYMVKILS